MFITFEGVEGCGKTTQVALLASELRRRGLSILQTREPGGSPVGADIRRILLAEGRNLTAAAELLLYGAERAEHVAQVIVPALRRGDWVLCDRYGDATRAYQAFGRGLARELVEAVHSLATSGLEPDLTLWIKVPVEASLARARRRNLNHPAGEGRFEAEELAFHERVASGYAALAAQYHQRILEVDGEGTSEEVASRVLRLVERRLGL